MQKKHARLLAVAAGMAISAVLPAAENDLRFLGYSQEMIDEVNMATGERSAQSDESAKVPADEVSAVQEQLTELGATRSLPANLGDRSGEIRDEVLSYWEKMTPDAKKSVPLSDELKATLNNQIKSALEKAGYRIVQLDLVDLPQGSLHNRLRAIVRVSREVKGKNSYPEIQKNLAEVKQICSEAATIDNFCYLSELTTFVAENPKTAIITKKPF